MPATARGRARMPRLMDEPYKGSPSTRSRIRAEKRGVLPLGISLPLGPVIGYHLGDIAKDFPSRVRDLHICDLHYDDTNNVRNLEHFTPDEPMPMLESLCVHFKSPVQPLDENGRYRYSFVPPFTTDPDWVPKLRRLCLCSCDLASNTILSSLTHLALHSIQIRRVHTRVESILSACNALQFLHLDKLIDDNHLYGAPPGFSLPKPTALQTCHRLRRVSLRSMASYLASYISSLVSADQPELALQLLHIEWPRGTLHLQLPGGVSRLTLGRYPTLSTQGEFRWWGMSACGSRHTLRTAAVTIEGAAEPLLRPDASAALADVRTLWLADVATLTSPGLYSFEVPVLKAAIAAFPILDTIVLANHFQSDWAEGGRPSLFLLPDARGAAVQPRISTLRIVHGYGMDLYKQGDFVGAAPPEGHPLNLTRILAELASGAYDYLEHLVIEVPGHVRVDARQVARLRPHFKTTQVRVVDETPTMALPEYCVEPRAWPRDVKEPWPHRIW